MPRAHLLRFVVAVFLAALPAAPALAGQRGKTAPEMPFLRASGTRIVDERGRPVRLEGVNLGGWLLWEGWIYGGGFDSETGIVRRLAEVVGPQEAERFRSRVYDRFITEDDITRIRAAGFNVVRVPMNHRLLDGDGPDPQTRPEGWRVLDRLIGWCRKHGVYVVLDLHGAPGAQSDYFIADAHGRGELWRSQEAQTRTAALWHAVARRYRDEPAVAGYDLLNEPVPPGGADLVDLYRRIVAVIRLTDKRHIVFVEGAKFAADFSMFDAPLGPNQAYSFHMYTWLGDDRARRLEGLAALARRQGVPIWNGEWGQNRPEMLTSTARLFRKPEYLVSGSCYWTWKQAPGMSPALNTIQVPASWKRLIQWVSNGRGRRPTAEEARKAMQEFLQAVDIKRCKTGPAVERAIKP